MAPRNINYSNIIIYKIVCNDRTITDLYVGSTSCFKSRKRAHKSDCSNEQKSHYNSKLYTTIRANGGWLNWVMIEVEKYPCSDGNEARARERIIYDQLNASLNGNRPHVTEDEFKVRVKKYYDSNNGKIRQQKQQYYAENKDKRKLYNDANKDKHKAYYAENKDKFKEYNKQYRNANKEKIRQYRDAHKNKNI
jgi:hypothetical protein